MGLIDRDTPPSAYEPSVNNTSYGRDQIRNLVRACILETGVPAVDIGAN